MTVQISKLPSPYLLEYTEEREITEKRFDLAWCEIKEKDMSNLKPPISIPKDQITWEIAVKHWGAKQLFGHLIPQILADIIDESTAPIAGIRTMEIKQYLPLALEAVIDMEPAIEAPFIDSLDIKAEWDSLDLKDINKGIQKRYEDLLQQHIKFTEINEPLTEDTLILATLIVKNKKEILQDISFRERVASLKELQIPEELKRHCLGKLAGVQYTSKLQFPKEYNKPGLNGKHLDWEIHIYKHLKHEYPTENEISKILGFSRPEELLDDLTNKEIEARKTALYERILSNIMNTLLNQTRISTIPDSMVDAMIDKELQSQKQKQKMTTEEESQFKKEKRSDCHRQCVTRLVAKAFAKKHNWKITDDDLVYIIKEYERAGVYSSLKAAKLIEDIDIDTKIREQLVDITSPRIICKKIWAYFQHKWKQEVKNE